MGVLARSQVRVSDWRLRKNLASGGWRVMFPGVFWPRRQQPLLRAWCKAALLWAGPEAVLSGETAAILHQLDGRWSQDLVHLTRRPRTPLRHPRVKVRCSEVPPEDIVQVEGMRCTNVERTLVDLASTTAEENLAIAFESAWRRDPLVPELIRCWLPLLRGGRGSAMLAQVLKDSDRRKRPLRSALEVMLWRFLREHRFPVPDPDFTVWDDQGAMVIDFLFPERGIALEADGYAWHGGQKKRFDHDALRRGRLTALGLLHVSVTHDQLTKGREPLKSRLRETFARHPRSIPKPEVHDYETHP